MLAAHGKRNGAVFIHADGDIARGDSFLYAFTGVFFPGVFKQAGHLADMAAHAGLLLNVDFSHFHALLPYFYSVPYLFVCSIAAGSARAVN
jgi:hypothetical protein